MRSRTFRLLTINLMHYIIITGVSRGIGEAICKQFAKPGFSIIGVSRTDNRDLETYMLSHGARFKLAQIDLSKTTEAEDWEHELFASLELGINDSITLYNNAGVLGPVKHIENAPYASIAKNFNVNLIAPIQLTSAFLRQTADFTGEKRIINISSGAALHAYDGWSCYCSSKAGLNMFTQAIGLEQKSAKHPAKITAIAPGIIDTAMQDEIRASNQSDFGMVHKFSELKESGSLVAPDAVAEKLAQLATGSIFNDGGIMDIAELS